MFRDTAPHSSTIAGITWYLVAVAGAVCLAVAVALVLVWRRRDRTDGEDRTDPRYEPRGPDVERADGVVRWLGVYLPIVVLVVILVVLLVLALR